MPTYGEKKKKDIIESVLPCMRKKARETRKTFRRINRQERRRVGQAVSNMYARGATASDVIDSYDADPFDFHYNLDADRRSAMWTRRDYDNLSSLYRWAPSQVEDVRLEDRASKIRSLLPDNVIGRHAAGHVADLDGFRVTHPSSWDFFRTTPEERNEARWIEYAEWHERLVILCENGKLSRFNDLRVSFKQVSTPISTEEYQQHRRNGTLSLWGIPWVTYDRRAESYMEHKYVFRPLLGRNDIPDFIAEAFDGWRRLPEKDIDTLKQTIKDLTM